MTNMWMSQNDGTVCEDRESVAAETTLRHALLTVALCPANSSSMFCEVVTGDWIIVIRLINWELFASGRYKLSDGVLSSFSVWSKMQMAFIRSSWCHHHPSLVSIKYGMINLSAAGLSRLSGKEAIKCCGLSRHWLLNLPLICVLYL